jgi:hypothetical protein
MDAAAGPLVLARHELSRGRPDRALAALEKVTGSGPETHEFWSVRAPALFRLHRWNDAVAAAHAGLQREPDSVELLEVLALAYSELRNKDQALEAIETAISLYPDAAVLHAHKALILARNAANAIGFASYRKGQKEKSDDRERCLQRCQFEHGDEHDEHDLDHEDRHQHGKRTGRRSARVHTAAIGERAPYKPKDKRRWGYFALPPAAPRPADRQAFLLPPVRGGSAPGQGRAPVALTADRAIAVVPSAARA